jgi:hypothetical protein
MLKQVVDKVRLPLVQIVKAYEGVEMLPYAFLTSELDGGEWSASRLAALPPTRSLRYPQNNRVGRPQRQSVGFGEEKNILPFLGSKPQFLGRLASSLVTILTRIQGLVVYIVTIVFGSANGWGLLSLQMTA